MTTKHRVVKFPGDEPEQGIDGYGWKDFEQMRVCRCRRCLSFTLLGLVVDSYCSISY